MGHDGRVYVMVFWSDFGQIISPGTVFDGDWHHVAVTYDGATETAYLDGKVIGTRYMTQVGYANTFKGIVDEASIYNRALTPAEVDAIVAAGGAGKCPPATSDATPLTNQAPDQSTAAPVTPEANATNQ